MREAFSTCMCAVRGRESIVAIKIAKFRHFSRKCRIIRRLARMIARVFEQQNLSRMQRTRRRLRTSTDAIGAEHHVTPERLFKCWHQGLQAHLWNTLPFGATKMRQQDRHAASGQDVLYRRHNPLNARRVCDDTIFHRDIDIYARQDTFSLEIHLIQCGPSHVFSPALRRFTSVI